MRHMHRVIPMVLGLLLVALPVPAALGQTSGETMIVQRIVDLYPGSEDSVNAMRADDMGWGQIIMVLDLANLSGMTVDDIRAKLDSGMGFGQIAQELDIAPGELGRAVAAVMSQSQSQAGQAESRGAGRGSHGRP